VHFIVGRPHHETLVPAYQRAIEILQRVPFENAVFEEDEIDEVLHIIEDEVRQHEGEKRPR
jgi:hypothetical protein